MVDWPQDVMGGRREGVGIRGLIKGKIITTAQWMGM